MFFSSFSLINNHIHFFVQLLHRNPSAILFEGFSIIVDSSISVVESLSPVLPFDCECRCFLVNIQPYQFIVYIKHGLQVNLKVFDPDWLAGLE